MKIERFDRVVIVVKDIEESMKFFSDVFGIKFDEVGGSDIMGVDAVYSEVGIELMSPRTDQGPIAQYLQKRGEGLYALAFKVSNLEEAMKEAESKGIRSLGVLDMGPMKEGMLHPKDTHGTLIILTEYQARHPVTATVLIDELKKKLEEK